tara:strand:+ start:301 stop:690 length:390 start_codon:yes stop_codon:yes gene_type:complete
MVTIQINGGFLDFESPIYMDEQKQKEFIKGMKSIFGERILVTKLIENKKVLPNIERHPKKFDVNDMILLANSELEQDKIAQKLKKSSFAIQMKRGPFLIQLMTWAKKKNLSKLNEKDVKEFLREIGHAN